MELAQKNRIKALAITFVPSLLNHGATADGIRGHWLIENSLHWVKDVIYEEDISPQKAGFAPRVSARINIKVLLTI